MKLFYSLIILCGSLLQLSAQHAPDVDEINSFLNSLAERKMFNGVVLAAIDDSVIYQNAFGYADKENAIPLSINSAFPIASITKQFTAAAILKLYEDGKLCLFDEISDYFPDIENSCDITTHDLLTHTSGIPDYNDADDYWLKLPLRFGIDQSVEWIASFNTNGEPGEVFNYSSSGYILLAAMIEKISGKTYDDFVLENLFKPAGLSNTYSGINRQIIKNKVKPYFNFNGKTTNAPYVDLSTKLGSGSLISTAGDLFKWSSSLKSHSILSEDSIEKMFSNYEHGYGYGWGIGSASNMRYFEHDGGMPGVSTYICLSFEPDLFFVILSNVSDEYFKVVKAGMKSLMLGDPEYENSNDLIASYEIINRLALLISN